MKHSVLTLLLAALCPTTALCQNAETATVVYVDRTATATQGASAAAYADDAAAAVGNLESRQGKFKVKYVDNSFMTEGVKRCLRMALDAWEERLDIAVPIHFNVTASETLDPQLEMRTTVAYASYGSNALPTSLQAQADGKERGDAPDEIAINALTDWQTSWPNDGTPWGTVNLRTALLRHIAHVLGFGTSVVEQDGEPGFAVSRTASPFDCLVSNGQATLGSMAATATPTSLNDFFKGDVSLNTDEASYRLFSEPTGYVPYRSGNYFSLPDDNILNYPYGDSGALMTVNDETLDAMAAIGWKVNPHDLSISGSDTDALGYGSLYATHTFRAEDAAGNSKDGTWTYQAFDNTARAYVDRTSGQGAAFTVTPTCGGADCMDGFACAQGRVAFTADGRTYTLPLTLDARPLFVDYGISNVQENAGTDYYSFDLTIQQHGATGGDVIVSSDYGTLCTLPLDGSDEQTVHVANALNIGYTYLTVNLENEYGTAARYITINPQSTQITTTTSDHAADLFDVYTLQGVLIGRGKRTADLGKGTYIIKSATGAREGRKITIR